MDRGRTSTYLKPAILRQEEDLSIMNDGKVGHPYEYTDLLIIAGFAVKSVFKIGYREAEGNVADYMDKIGITQHPNFRTIHWRISEMEKDGIKFRIYQRDDKNLEVVIDSTGVRSVNDGEYRSTKYGKVKVWKKMHIAINPKTHRILNIEITNSDVGDSCEFITLMNPIEEMNDVESATADGAYDSEKNFEHCDENHIEPIIPVRIDASGKNGRHRRKHVEDQLGVKRRRGRNQNRSPPKNVRRRNQDKWKERSGYHRRSLTETVISVFKGTFGEYIFSRNDEMKEKELLLKAVVYNTFLA